MAERYVDSATGSNGDNGTTQALAWATIEYALESGALSAGDNVWVRRGHSEIPVSNIALAYSGTASSPISTIGWPRAVIPDTTITQADWTNGSATVDNIVGITCARTSHQGRFAAAPDGKKYLITRVVDSNTVMIDREYSGSTVTGTSGKFAIDEDDDYANRPTDVDGWDSDGATLALIDFNSTAFQIYWYNIDYIRLKNLEIKDSTNAYGNIWTRASKSNSVIGCLIKQSNNVSCVRLYTFLLFERTIFEGSGSGASQSGVWCNGATASFKNCAIYNMGGPGILTDSTITSIENLNIGVEQANGSDDIAMVPAEHGFALLRGRDIALGGTNGYVTITADPNAFVKVLIENFQKVLGDHKVWYLGGEYINVDVGDTNAPSVASTSGNTTDLFEITPNVLGYEFIPEWAPEFPLLEVVADTSSKTYTFYIQNNMGATINDGDAKGDIWIEAEYVSQYDGPSKYIMEKISSAEATIADRADDTDWDSLSVTIQPAVASKVRIKLYIVTHSAAGRIYIDPLPVIT